MSRTLVELPVILNPENSDYGDCTIDLGTCSCLIYDNDCTHRLIAYKILPSTVLYFGP